MGTPTYAVIAPNASVAWNQSIASLDAALAGTGAERVDSPLVLWIAPNPSVDFLNLYAKAPPTGDITVAVYNILGRRMYSFEPVLEDGSLLLHEDVSTWISGTYLVRIEQAGKVLKTMRFVKR